MSVLPHSTRLPGSSLLTSNGGARRCDHVAWSKHLAPTEPLRSAHLSRRSSFRYLPLYAAEIPAGGEPQEAEVVGGKHGAGTRRRQEISGSVSSRRKEGCFIHPAAADAEIVVGLGTNRARSVRPASRSSMGTKPETNRRQAIGGNKQGRQQQQRQQQQRQPTGVKQIWQPSFLSPPQHPSTHPPPHSDQGSPVTAVASAAGSAGGMNESEEDRMGTHTHTEDKSKEEVFGSSSSSASGDTGELEFEHRVAMDLAIPPDVAWRLWVDIERAPQWMRWIERVDILPLQPSPLLASEAAQGSAAGPVVSASRSSAASECPDSDTLQRRIAMSRWTCCTTGFEVSWTARVLRVCESPPERILTWQTVEGIPCRGQVTIRDTHTTENTGTQASTATSSSSSSSSSSGSANSTMELLIWHQLPRSLARIMSEHALSALIQATLRSDIQRFEQYAQAHVKMQ